MKTKQNSISTVIWILGISIAISIVFLIIAKVFADNWDAAITVQNSAVYSYAHSRTLYPFLTWSIAGVLMLASAIAVIYSHRKASRTAIIAVLYLASAILVTKSAALCYCATQLNL